MRICRTFALIFVMSVVAMQTGRAVAGNPQAPQRTSNALASASRPPQHPEFPPLRNPDPEVNAGYRIAQDICETCHVIHPDQRGRPILREPGPNFVDIANRQGLTKEFADPAHREPDMGYANASGAHAEAAAVSALDRTRRGIHSKSPDTTLTRSDTSPAPIGLSPIYAATFSLKHPVSAPLPLPDRDERWGQRACLKQDCPDHPSRTKRKPR